MATLAVNVRRHDASLDLQADLRRVRALAKLLDAQFSVAGFRFGLDAIIGLVPGLGDVATGALVLATSVVLTLRAHRIRLTRAAAPTRASVGSQPAGLRAGARA